MKKTTKTEYFYNEVERLCRSVTTETSECSDCGGCEDGELMTGKIEFTEDGPTFADVALALAGLGLCLTAVATVFKRR